jgi:hypothetical protein
VLKGGINRLKVKGGASANMVYDMTNAYVTAAGTIVPREGTIRAATLTSSSVGLAAFDTKLNVFSTSLISVPSGYVDNLLLPPSTSAATTLTKIWFAKPFLGFLYVVAEFNTGEIFHYWLQSNGTWEANTVYQTGAIVTPLASPNGLAYQAVRDMPANSTWQPQTTITSGTMVEPTTYTGYAYRAVNVEGSTPHTGSTEPVWPTTSGGTIQEFGDFDTSSSDSGTTQPQSSGTVTSSVALGSNITDRYGDSSEIAGQVGTTTTSTAPSVTAANVVTVWAAGTTYAPGAVVQPSTGQGAFINAIPNGDFEDGNDGNWTLSHSNVTIGNTDPYQGSFALQFALGPGEGVETATMFNFGVVKPGQSVTASAYLDPNNVGADTTMNLILNWYDSTDTFISSTSSAGAQGGGYRPVSVTGSAPANAAHVRVQIKSASGTSPNPSYADLVSWNLETPAAVSNFLYEAVQASAGTSGSTEPAWPTVAGNEVTDGTVTWEAIGTSIITWQAVPIMESGGTEPTWPTVIGNTVNDPSTFTTSDAFVNNTSMSWIAINRQVPTPNPSNAVAIGSSHVFNGDNDITDYSAAVDPTDWTSANNAGYLPTGLNNYGDNPVAVLALYRSNLMVFNAGGYQMWQIDPDPQNMALLDAEPVGSIYTRSAQSVANDLLILTEVGVRNIGMVGATANMQVGNAGQPIDPLVKAQLVSGNWPAGSENSLYYPGRGQYWLIFGSLVFVLTINGSGQRSWSRYTFPDTITDATLNEGVLYLRTGGNLVWQFDYETLVDDSGGNNTAFTSTIQWPYLDMGTMGMNKFLVGVDTVGFGDVSIQIAYQQADVTTFSDHAGFSTSVNVTAPYNITISDTIPGQPIPFPINAPSYSLILSWNSNQGGVGAPNSPSWEWEGASLYLNDQGGAGATG